MSQKDNDVVVVDLTKEVKTGSATKKKSQMRDLSNFFSKIDKNAALAKMESDVKKLSEDAQKKRKLSVSSNDGEDEKSTGGGNDDKKGVENSPAVVNDHVMKVKIGSAKKKPKMENNAEVVEKTAADKDDELMVVAEVKNKKSTTESSSLKKNSSPKTPKTPKATNIKNKEKENPSEENLQSKVEVVASTNTPLIIDSIIKTPEPNQASKRKTSDVSTPQSEASPSEKIQKLTPKQLARKAEFEKKRLEKEKLKEEAKKAKEAERLKREMEKTKEREEKERQKEAERVKKEMEKKEKEEEREKLKKEKEEEKEKLKKEKLEEKERQKREKEMEKEEAAKKKQEEKEEKERQEKAKAEKQNKAKQSFANFFVKKETPKDPEEKSPEVESRPANGLNQFRIKQNMKLAPLSRKNLDESMKAGFDAKFNSGMPKKELYVSSLKTQQFKPLTMGKTWPFSAFSKKSEDDDDVMIIDEDEEDLIGDEISTNDQEQTKQNQTKVKTVFRRAKLLQFYDNQRPPYFGTWTKTSGKVNARKPFAMDSEYFDYDYDSDDDWEEEEQGESLSDEEKDKEEDEKEAAEGADEDDEDDGFFVGHGVLDKDELKAVEEDGDEDGAFDEDLEIKKQQLKAQQFEEEYKKKKPSKLKPRVFGCVWNDPNNACNVDEKIAYDQLMKILTPFKAVSLLLAPIIPTSFSEPKDNDSNENSPRFDKAGGEDSTSGKPKYLKQVPEEAMPDLIRLVHANINNKNFLVKEFLSFWSSKKEENNLPIPKSKILQKIQEIAEYQKSETLARKCWMVKMDVLKTYGVTEPEIPNKWDYVLDCPNKSTATPTTPVASRGTSTPTASETERSTSTETPKSEKDKKTSTETPKSEKRVKSGNIREKPPPSSLITKFTRVLSEEERLQALKDAAEKAKTAKAEEERLKAEKEASAEKAKITNKLQQPTLVDLTEN